MTNPKITVCQQMNSRPRHQAAPLRRSQLPAAPGIYCWYREGRPVYAGVAAGGSGLRGRLWTHLETGVDLSRSAFRRNVLEYLGIATVAAARLRPSVLTIQQVAPVNRWISECELTWMECATEAEAKALERTLLLETKPLLNRR